MAMKHVEIEAHQEDWIKTIHQGWAVLTVQDQDKVNGMTVNWVQIGYLWNRPVVSVYVRPQRHTFGLINEASTFSLAFFDDSHRANLAYLGKASGKEEDKLKHCEYSVSYTEQTPWINEARMVLLCKKCYVQDMDKASFLDPTILDSAYPKEDFHRLIVAEITDTLIQE